MKIYTVLLTTAAVVCFASCRESEKQVEQTLVCKEADAPVWTFNDNDVELGTTDFYSFDIERDYTTLKQKMWTDPGNKMYVENTAFDDSIHVMFCGSKAVVTGDDASGVSVKTNGASVVINATKNVECTLTGKSTEGSLQITGTGKVRINLHGVTLRSAKGPAICDMSDKPCFIVTDSVSVLSDDSVYAQVIDSLQPKGCVCSKGKLIMSGTAPLKITANGADAIHSSKSIFVRRGSNIDIESHAGSGIKAKNNVMIEGGMININSTGRGGHGITAKKEVAVAGGRTTIISCAARGKDGKCSRGIRSDSLVTITGGIVRVKESSLGGKGIRAGYKFHARNCIIDVLTSGKDCSDSKNRGISAVEELRIDSSRVRVRAENGWTEGLSCRHKILLNNCLVELKTRDDGISAGDPDVADFEANNARVYVDAGMDAIDSNGTIHVNSGLFLTIAHSHGSRGFDCDFNEFKIGPEAILVGLGQITSPPTSKLLEHPACFFTRSLEDKEFYMSLTGKNDNIISFQLPKLHFTDTGIRVLLSVPEMKENVSYDFCREAIIKNPKHTFHGLSIGGTLYDKDVTDNHVFTKKYNNFVTSH